MAFPKFTMKELIEAGCHFGHHTRRWNPKMAPYIFGVKDKIHIIDLQKTVPMLHAGLMALRNTVSQGGKVPGNHLLRAPDDVPFHAPGGPVEVRPLLPAPLRHRRRAAEPRGGAQVEAAGGASDL